MLGGPEGQLPTGAVYHENCDAPDQRTVGLSVDPVVPEHPLTMDVIRHPVSRTVTTVFDTRASRFQSDDCP